MMETNKIIEIADNTLLHTYNRYKIVLQKGDGVYLYDTDGKKYLDFAAGIAVFSLGYNNERYNMALNDQISNLVHTSNLFYNEPAMNAGRKLVEATGLKRVFFTNSGTEAIEGAIKLARKYAYNKNKGENAEIIAMEHSFHGRSVGALSVTGNTHYQEAFKPLMGGVKFAKFNDIESIKSNITDKTCAIIMETLQGEGGIYTADYDFMKEVRALCDEKDIILILDEIQCGMGRTGYMFAYEKYGIKPDIVTVAKALGNGIPVGAFVAGEKVYDAMVPGDHGTTYGGNPLATRAADTVLDIFKEDKIVEHVKELTPYFEEKLDELVNKYAVIKERRGMGFMQGLVLDILVGEVILKAQENGLIVISASGNVLRLVPPLVITKEDIDLMVEKLSKSFDELTA